MHPSIRQNDLSQSFYCTSRKLYPKLISWTWSACPPNKWRSFSWSMRELAPLWEPVGSWAKWYTDYIQLIMRVVGARESMNSPNFTRNPKNSKRFKGSNKLIVWTIPSDISGTLRVYHTKRPIYYHSERIVPFTIHHTLFKFLSSCTTLSTANEVWDTYLTHAIKMSTICE